MIEKTSKEPIQVKQYSINSPKGNDVDEEVEAVLGYVVIEPAMSNSPTVMVHYRTNRFYIDIWKVNLITKFDTEPMNIVDDILNSFNAVFTCLPVWAALCNAVSPTLLASFTHAPY